MPVMEKPPASRVSKRMVPPFFRKVSTLAMVSAEGAACAASIGQ